MVFSVFIIEVVYCVLFVFVLRIYFLLWKLMIVMCGLVFNFGGFYILILIMFFVFYFESVVLS